MPTHLANPALYSGAFSESRQGLILLERKSPDEFEILATNRRAAQYGAWPFEHDSVVGQLIADVFPGIREGGFMALYNDALARGEPVELAELEYEDAVIPDAVFAITFVPVTAEHLMIEFRNITEFVETRNELIRSKEELEEFAFVAAHDLRSPAQKVQALIQILADVADDPDEHETRRFCMDEILQLSDRMQSLIDGLLSLARIGSEEHQFATVDLAQQMAQVVADLGPLLRGGAKIELGALPHAYGQPSLLRQLFYNLVENGLKYRREGVTPLVSVSGEVVESSLGSPRCIVKVSDNGIGFETRHADDIFTMFRRLHRSEHSGTGIGLALCRRIAELHRGAITAESEPGRGSCFTVNLPVAAPAPR